MARGAPHPALPAEPRAVETQPLKLGTARVQTCRRAAQARRRSAKRGAARQRALAVVAACVV